MDLLTITAISVGILSALWAFLSSTFGLVTWVGFIGCTSYYASGGKFKGLKNSVYSNMSGVFWAMAIILCSSVFNEAYLSYVFTGFFSFVMCFQAKSKKLEFIPGAFCGACSTFGLNGDYKSVIIALLCGALLGYSSDMLGLYTHKKFILKK